MPDVENPNYLTQLIDFIENTVDAAPLAEKQTANFPRGLLGLSS